MGFNKRFVILERCIEALEQNSLKNFYGKSDLLIFEDETSEKIYDLFVQGKTEEEILTIIKQKK